MQKIILPPFTYEKVENRKKIGTILMRGKKSNIKSLEKTYKSSPLKIFD